MAAESGTYSFGNSTPFGGRKRYGEVSKGVRNLNVIRVLRRVRGLAMKGVDGDKFLKSLLLCRRLLQEVDGQRCEYCFVEFDHAEGEVCNLWWSMMTSWLHYMPDEKFQSEILYWFEMGFSDR